MKNHAGYKALGKGGRQVNPLQETSVTVSCIRQRAPSGWKQFLLPISSSAALSFSLPTFGMDCSQCLFEVRKHVLLIQLGKQDAGKAHFPRLHWELSRWSTSQNRHAPGKLCSFASELSQTLVPCPGLRQQGRWSTGQCVISRNKSRFACAGTLRLNCGHCSALCLPAKCRSQKHIALSQSLSPILF